MRIKFNKHGQPIINQDDWEEMLQDIEENGNFIEQELAKIARRQERIKDEDAEDAPYRRKIVK